MRFGAFLVAALLVGCSGGDDPTPPKSDKPAAWLELFNAMGEWERVALIYGYWDDYEGCMDIRNALTAKFERQYRCVPTS